MTLSISQYVYLSLKKRYEEYTMSRRRKAYSIARLYRAETAFLLPMRVEMTAANRQTKPADTKAAE